MARNVYRVVAEGRLWAVVFGGRPVATFRVRDNAVRRARQLAWRDQPSVVTVHGPDGSVELEVPIGHDPYPTSG